MAIVGQGTKIIIFNAGYSASADRYNFINAAQSIPTSSSEDLCHYISFDYIKSILVAAANKFYRGEHDHNTFLQNIRLLCEAVKTGERKVNTPAMNAVYTNIDAAVAALESVSNNTQDMSDTLNTLLYNLNSADTNLRAGDSRWNHSIGQEYDPESWVYCGSNGQIMYTNLKLNDEERAEIEESVLADLNAKGDYAEWFYLVNYTDCKKYELLCSLNEIEPPSIFSAQHINGNKLLYSSANYILDFDDNRRHYRQNRESVYYFHYN